MKTLTAICTAATLFAVSACQNEPAPAVPQQPAASASDAAPSASDTGPAMIAMPDYSAWAGRWTGPEGLFANIEPAGSGKYKLEIKSDLDAQGTYDGVAVADGIQFTRNGEQLILRKATGDETGLKYLAGKSDCLMIATGQGFCRD